MSQSNKIILLDSDVISHFIANNCLADLPTILAPHQCMDVDYVYAEIARNLFRKAVLDWIIESDTRQDFCFYTTEEFLEFIFTNTHSSPLLYNAQFRSSKLFLII